MDARMSFRGEDKVAGAKTVRTLGALGNAVFVMPTVQDMLPRQPLGKLSTSASLKKQLPPTSKSGTGMFCRSTVTTCVHQTMAAK